VVNKIRTPAFVSLLFAGALCAQELQWDSLWQQGIDFADRTLGEIGYEVDREALASVPRPSDVLRFLSGIKEIVSQGSIEQLAWLKPEVEATLSWLEQWPAAAPYVSWLRQQADYFMVAADVVAETRDMPRRAPPQRGQAPKPLELPRNPPSAPPLVLKQAERRAQSPDVWRKRIASRPAPARAAELSPKLKSVFKAEGLPPELIWLAEVESGFDPYARSPVGAVGLFQFMPATAKRFGLNTERPDERLAPEKSARAAASYLRFLHSQFGSWPLALAGYNAGEGRVGRALRARRAKSFEEIADALPLETRMYVPKIAAVIEHREGVALAALPPPR
jgi:membrane-bound lytic murein transglycosylase D